LWIEKSKEYGNLNDVFDICDIIINLNCKSDNIINNHDLIHQGIIKLKAYKNELDRLIQHHQGEDIYHAVVETSKAVLLAKFDLLRNDIETYLKEHSEKTKRRKYIIYLFKAKLKEFKDLPYIGYTSSKSRRFISHILETITQFNERGAVEKLTYFKQALLSSLRIEFDIVKSYIKAVKCYNNEKLENFEDLERILLEIKNNNYPVFASLLTKIYFKVVLKYFIQEDLEEAFTLQEALEREHELTLTYPHAVAGVDVVGTIHPNGLNSVPGGGGSGLKGLVYDIPLYDVVALVSLGLKVPEISTFLTKAYNKLYTVEIIESRIHQIWGGFRNLQKIIFKPVVENLIKNSKDFSVSEICQVIRRTKPTLLKNLKSWYDDASFTDLKRLVKVNKLDWSNIAEILNDLNGLLRGRSVNEWISWIVQGIPLEDIASKCGYSYSYLSTHFKDMSHLFIDASGVSFRDTRWLLRKKIAKEKLGIGMSPSSILINIFKYKRSSFTSNLGEIRMDKIKNSFERLFKDEDLSYEQIISRFYCKKNNKYLGNM